MCSNGATAYASIGGAGLVLDIPAPVCPLVRYISTDLLCARGIRNTGELREYLLAATLIGIP